MQEFIHFTVLTLLPQLFDSYLDYSIMKRAKKKGLLKVDLWNIRDFAKNKHRTTDDRPYGGGPGMVMTCQPLFDAIKAAKKVNKGPVIFLTPRGRVLRQATVRRLARQSEMILVCGRYEGIDQRVVDIFVDEEISIGRYVLTGGELPAMVLIDAITRLGAGVLGDDKSAEEDSFSLVLDGKREYPHYTKPEVFRGLRVPKVLLSGHHKEIEKWRRGELGKK